MKRSISMIFALLLVVILAAPSASAVEGAPRVVDNAQLLTGDVRRNLEKKADALSEKYQFDFVIVTVDTTGAATPRSYADDFFDYNHYGFGPDRDGILLLVSMTDRDWWVSTRGFGTTAFTEYGLEYMMDRVLPPLSDGNYEGAFETFLEQGESLLKQARNGKPLDVPERFGGFPFVSLVVCAALGFGLAFLPMSGLKKQVKNVESRLDAMEYASKDGLELNRKTDRFLYTSVSKTPRPKDTSSSSSGGSKTHTSSSGATHGGTGGKF